MGRRSRGAIDALVQKRVFSLPITDHMKRALLAAAAELRADRKVLGVAVIGSISRGDPNPHDIDLLVLVRGTCAVTERWVRCGQPVHMLVRGRARFVAGGGSLPRHVYPPLADAVILWDGGGAIAAARRRHRVVRSRGPSRVLSDEIAHLRAELTTGLEDTEDVASESAAFAVLAADFVARCAEVHLRLNGCWVPRRKSLFAELEARAPAMARLCRKALSDLQRPRTCLAVLRRIAHRTLVRVGGFAKEFKVDFGGRRTKQR